MLYRSRDQGWTWGAKYRILQGGGANWLHGHWAGMAGIAYYKEKKTKGLPKSFSDAGARARPHTGAATAPRLRSAPPPHTPHST